ncbi:MAG TPA: glycoside hydrolase family 2 TIM barrel-domain containing protein [Verrucomicrobiae bacterium]|nr:glycoside hydrolase family 2 TIM barrel-domain containing protein [Verrucomicrobiae bacterium]
MKLLIRAAVFLWATAALSAAAMQNEPGRQGISLNGTWRVLIDPYLSGYYDFHGKLLGEKGIGANRAPKSLSDHEENGIPDNSPTLTVPGDWNTQRPDLYYYESAVWYKRQFDFQAKPGRRQFLWFGAANYHAVVFLNGKQIGEHEGGFTPFQFEVTGKLQPRGNALIVMVDASRHADAVPQTMSDWWNYGGLTRSVRVLDVPETFVEDYTLQLEKGSTARLMFSARLNGPQPAQHVTVKIPEAGVAVSLDTSADGTGRVAFPANVTLWSPERPKLYDVSIELGSETIADRIGFRTIATSGQQILLNGKPVFIRGAAIHSEAPFRTGRVYSADEARTLLGWAKELGCNFVRLAHYAHDESMARMADEMGLLVWEEIPVYWAIQWENPATYANAERQLADTISRDKNRASVIFWSVANETPLGDARLKFLSSLANKARELDPTRLVTAATLTHETTTDHIAIDDPLGQYLDVLGINEYIGWYDGPPEKLDRVQWATPYNKPVVVSEFGAGAVAGNHGDERTAWTEENMAMIYRKQVAMFKRIPFLQGTSAWVLMDFRSPRRLTPQIQDGFNRKGLFSPQGQKKLAFYVLRDFYREKAAQAGQ